MEVKKIVLDSIREKGEELSINVVAADDDKLKDLGFDSIQFLGVVISICEKLNIDMNHVNSMEISTENTVTEFVNNFKVYLPNEMPVN
jgi:acyl carrier protein